MRRPKITLRVLDGIISSTSAHLAGGPADLSGYDNHSGREMYGKVARADAWARDMRLWMSEQEKKRNGV